MQGRGLHYDDAGNVYEGQWQEGMRHGEGQQLYGGRLPDHFGADVYDGQWENDNRCEFAIAQLVYLLALCAQPPALPALLTSTCLSLPTAQQLPTYYPLPRSPACDPQACRSGKGKMTYGNGDVFEGEWANDMKNGRGVHYYTARRKVYEGTWQEDVAKCGTYSELNPAADSHMPALKLQNAQDVLRTAEEELPKLVYY